MALNTHPIFKKKKKKKSQGVGGLHYFECAFVALQQCEYSSGNYLTAISVVVSKLLQMSPPALDHNPKCWDALPLDGRLKRGPSESQHNYPVSCETSYLSDTLACCKVGHNLVSPGMSRVNWSIKIPAALLQLVAALAGLKQPVSPGHAST